MRREQGKKKHFPPIFFHSLSLPKPEKPTTRLVPSLTPPRPHAERAMPCRGRGGCAVAAPMHATMPCTMRGQGRVALSPSAYKYRGSAGGKRGEG